MVQHKQLVIEKLMVKKIQTYLKKAPKFTVLVNTDPKDLENGDKRQEHFKKVILSDSGKEKVSKVS